MSQDTTTVSDNGQKAAKAKLAELLAPVIGEIDESQIRFVPYAHDDQPRTAVYINAPIDNEALEAVAHTLVQMSGQPEEKVAFSPSSGSGASIEFPGTMRNIADLDASAFATILEQQLAELAGRDAPVQVELNGDLKPTVRRILESHMQELRIDPSRAESWVEATTQDIAKGVRNLGKGAAAVR